MLKRISLFFLATIMTTTLSYAGKVPLEEADAIINKLSSARPDIGFDSVETTAIDGLYSVRLDSGSQSLYVSKDGEYIIDGEMYEIRPGRIVPVKDLEGDRIRGAMISGVNVDDMIVFPAVDETKAVVYIFTDVDCGYCRLLHNETVPELTLNGVEVRYLAFPRAGIGSSSYKKMASAWCAEDRQTAITMLKQKQPIDDNVCENNPVAAQLELGRRVGVTGTPAMVLEDGTLLPGYRQASALLRILGVDPV